MKETADTPRIPMPWWVWIIIVILAIPGLMLPFAGLLVASADTVVRGLGWLFPIYTCLSAFIAWQCWGRRTTLSWIIIALMLLSDLSVYYLANTIVSTMSYR
jgi:hypothetical protein